MTKVDKAMWENRLVVMGQAIMTLEDRARSEDVPFCCSFGCQLRETLQRWQVRLELERIEISPSDEPLGVGVGVKPLRAQVLNGGPSGTGSTISPADVRPGG